MLVCCLTAVRPHFIEASQAKFSSLGEPKKGTTNRQTWDMNDTVDGQKNQTPQTSTKMVKPHTPNFNVAQNSI